MRNWKKKNRILSDNRGEKTNYFFANPTRKEIFIKKTRKKLLTKKPVNTLKS